MKKTCDIYLVDFSIFLLIGCQKIKAEIQKIYTATSKDTKNLLQSTFKEEEENTQISTKSRR